MSGAQGAAHTGSGWSLHMRNDPTQTTESLVWTLKP